MVAAGLTCAALLAGCPRKQPPAPAPRPPVQPQTAEAARGAVVGYLRHLYAGDHAAAHAMLNAESRRRHPLDEFTRQAKEGMTYFNLSSASVKFTGRERAEVTLAVESDPATATILAVREEGAWRVVYVRGRPSFPYPS
jgi:hypothetical protein